MDEIRFQEMQQEAEQLVLLSSVLLAVYTTAGEAISGLPGVMESLKNTVNIMLADMHTPWVPVLKGQHSASILNFIRKNEQSLSRW